MPRVVRCPNCDAPLEVDLQQPVVRCQYCGCDIKQTIAIQTAPKPKPAPAPQPRPKPKPEPEPPAARPARTPNIGRSIRFWVFLVLVVSALPALHQMGILRRIPEWLRTVVRQVTGRDEAARRAGAPSTESNADRRLGEKLAVYADCLTADANRADRARQRYVSWQPNRAGPTCRERFISWGVPELGVNRASGGCGLRVGEFDSKPPKLVALEEAADKYVIALHELDDVLRAAHHYYDQKDYVEDHCAKGKELHTKMVDAFARWSTAETIPPPLEQARMIWGLIGSGLGAARGKR